MRLLASSLGLLLAAATAAHADDTIAPPSAPAAQPVSPALPPAAAPGGSAAAPAPSDAAPVDDDDTGPKVRTYMVARLKLNGTDLTRVIFFRHDAIATLEDCEAERTAGLTTGWTHYNARYLQTLKGISYKVDYRCVQSEQHLEFWHSGNPESNFYMVRTRDNKLDVQAYRNFFSCRDALKHDGGSNESIDVFCAASSQRIIKDIDKDTGDKD